MVGGAVGVCGARVALLFSALTPKSNPRLCARPLVITDVMCRTYSELSSRVVYNELASKRPLCLPMRQKMRAIVRPQVAAPKPETAVLLPIERTIAMMLNNESGLGTTRMDNFFITRD